MIAIPAYTPKPFRDRAQHTQVLTGGVAPAALGALAGVLVGVSAGAYWAVGIVAAIGGFLAGFEHRDGFEGAQRGCIGGEIYGVFLVIAHYAAGTHAKVSLGSTPPFLVVITAIIGALITAAGGRIARAQRERAATPSAGPPPPTTD